MVREGGGKKGSKTPLQTMDLRLHSSYAFFIRAYTHVKVEFA